jgi:hypothetical protein
MWGPPKRAVFRLHEEVDLNPKKTVLPEVHAVTRFLIRRQCRRRFSPRSISLLMDKLPRLESLIYEPWRSPTRLEQEKYDNGKQSVRDPENKKPPLSLTQNHLYDVSCSRAERFSC